MQLRLEYIMDFQFKKDFFLHFCHEINSHITKGRKVAYPICDHFNTQSTKGSIIFPFWIKMLDA